MAERSTRLPEWLMWLLALPATAAAWAFIDLFFRVELPGAAQLAHVGLRALVVPLEWLTVDGTSRLDAALAIWAGSGLGALLLRRTLAPFWLFATGTVLALSQGILLAVGCLMERAVAVGVVVATLAAAGWALSDARTPSEAPKSPARSPGAARWLGLLLAIGAGGAAASYVYAMFTSDPTGYDAVHRLGALVREGEIRPSPWLLGGAGALGVLLFGVLGRGGAHGRLALALLGGAVASLVARPWLDPGSPVAALLILTPAGALLVLALQPRSTAPLLPLPRALVGPCVAAALLIAGTYANRVYSCPEPGSIPGLQRVGTPGEVFRVVPGPEERFVALALRRDQRIGRWVPESGELDLDGPLREGAPEELVHVPGAGFFTSLVTEDPPTAPGPGGEPATNLLTRLDEDATQILGSDWVQVPCWVNTMALGPEGDLYVGCEDRAGLYRLDPQTSGPTLSQVDPGLGDVQAMAFGSEDEIFTISLWRRPTATRLARPTLAIEAQGVVGGSHFDIGYDEATDRVFASGWYASRIRVIDGRSLRTVGTLPTGFGARAIAVDPERRLLLVSSVYGGRVRVYELDELRLLASLPVGGHVKDIAVLAKTGRAVFWSQCGLYDLDLDELGGMGPN